LAALLAAALAGRIEAAVACGFSSHHLATYSNVRGETRQATFGDHSRARSGPNHLNDFSIEFEMFCRLDGLLFPIGRIYRAV
jgi:hypothetical protein